MTLTDSHADTTADQRPPYPTGLLIGGRVVDGRAEPIPVINPATGELITEVAGASADDIDDAVRTAHETFRNSDWPTMPIHDRAQLIQRFADGIEAHMAELYELETLNNGRPITETKAQITRLAEWYRYNAALLLADRTSVVPLRGDYHSYTSRFPLGVVGILASFNHPLMIASKSLAPGLGDRKHRGAQAFRADAADRADARQDRYGGRHPRRRAQRRPRPGTDGRSGAHRTPTRQEGCLHGRYRTRKGHRDRDRETVRQSDARTRRQVASPHLRRHPGRRRRTRRGLRRVRRRGPDLHRG